MSILQNAIDAIQTGIEDYRQGTPARLKSSVRNVHAGVLLLFKYKLQILSPDGSDAVLLKQRVLPVRQSGVITYRGTGKKTVDLHAIRQRFASLGIPVDWKAIEKINGIRNEVEHYFTTANEGAIREALATAFSVATTFLSAQLDDDLRRHLTEDVWDELIRIKQFYDAELKLCRDSVEHFQSQSEYAAAHAAWITCPACLSDLVLFVEGGGAVCRVCAEKWTAREMELAVIRQAGENDQYTAVKDGGEETVVDCPDCGEFAYVVSDSRCAQCEASFDEDCLRCGNPIPPSEIDGSGYCGWCGNVMSRDD